MIPAYFVTGTDTGSGKTTIASALIRHFVKQGCRTVGMKPIASGCEMVNDRPMNEDVTALIEASNVIAPIALVNPYCFMPAIAPHIAASQSRVNIDIEVISDAYRQLTSMADIIVVEGAGGFLVPVNENQTLADLAVQLDIPVIMVIGMRLGCINHALLTMEAIKTRGLTLAGWVANQVDPQMAEFEANLDTLKQRIDAPCLSVVAHRQVPEFTLC